MRDDPSSSTGPLRRHGLNGLLAAFLVGMVGFLILGPERVTLVAPQFLFFFGAALLAWRALWRRAWWRALAWTAAGVAWIYYYHDANKWLQSLGSDSFAETTAPTFEEFWFWLKTMGQILQPSLRPWTAAIFVAVVAALITLIEVVALIARVPRPGRHHRVGQFAKLVLVASIVSFFARSVMAYAENTSMQDKITGNFAAPAGLAAVARRPLDVVVYIGESTTMMHWGLYGYPRRTTPELAKRAAEDPGLLVFRNVFSTHTHTSQSLFEALSVAARAGEEGLPITDRHRVSVADILMAAGVRTTLYSNQGRAGTFNMMAPVIFGKAPQIYSAETRLAGNMDVNVEKPFDDAFFAGTGVRAVKEGPAPSVTFLHSNAGHGPYLSRLPESFRKPVDDLLAGAAPEAVVGQGAGLVADVEEYDTAMAYVDHNVAAQLRDVAALPRPTVLIYFSDHGEAPGDRRGHESSRFLHEMMRVPFLVYFNEAARQAEPRLFARYQALAAAGQPASLAQFPATLFDLLDLAVTGGLPAGGADLPAVGNAAILPPVLVRGLGRGPSAIVDLNGQPQRWGDKPLRFSGDAVTAAYLGGRRLGAGTETCYGGADSFMAARRGSLVATCLGFDVAVASGAATLYAEGAARPGLSLVLKVAAASRLALWVRLVGGDAEACTALPAALAAEGQTGPVVVELASGLAEVPACVAALRGAGVEAVMALDGKQTAACSAELGGGMSFAASPACAVVDAAVAAVAKAGVTGAAVAASDLAAVRQAPSGRTMRWHGRGVTPNPVPAPDLAQATRILFETVDPDSQERLSQ